MKMNVGHSSAWITRGVVVFLAAICMRAAAQVPIWSEEFDTHSVPDSSVWSYDMGTGPPYPGWGNEELQSYTSNTNNVRVEGGNLIITAVRSGDNFTSARVKTQDKLTFMYGTVEARIKTPDLGNGLWPAFWTMGNNISSVGWPACGEIDIMEMGSAGAIAADPSVVNERVGSHAHWGSLPDHPNYGDVHDYGSDIDGTFVIYRMEWTPTSITTFINDEQIWIMNITGISEFHTPHFFLLNLAVGGKYTGIYDPGSITAPFDADYVIDYIRIYDNGHTVLGGSSLITPCTNLLDNPGFESGLSDWTLNISSGSASASTAYAHSGSHSLVIDSTGVGAWNSPNMSQSFPASSGEIYNLQGYMLNPAGSPIAGNSFGLFKIEFRDSGGTPLNPVAEIGSSAMAPYYGAESRPFLTAGSATDTWVFSETQAVAPVNTAWVSFILLNVNETSVLGPMYFDDVQAMLIRHPTLPVTLNASLVGDNIQISFPTEEGVCYKMAYKHSLTNDWIRLETIAGSGETNTVSYPADEAACFYGIVVP